MTDDQLQALESYILSFSKNNNWWKLFFQIPLGIARIIGEVYGFR
jgi:hypothetical protein